jgi:hypothetical protein
MLYAIYYLLAILSSDALSYEPTFLLSERDVSIVILPIKSNPETHTVIWLKHQDDDGILHKNISIQRKEVWDAEKKSNLIVSLLLDIPNESLLFEESEDGSFNVLDGKQRTLTLCAFVAD